MPHQNSKPRHSKGRSVMKLTLHHVIDNNNIHDYEQPTEESTTVEREGDASALADPAIFVLMTDSPDPLQTRRRQH